MTSYILIHGMFHGGWCWQQIAERLGNRGHHVVAPDLPLTSLADDADAVSALLDSFDGPKVLVGHSYGGLVVSRAAADRNDIGHLVYVAAMMIPADADPIAEGVASEKLTGALELSDDGWISIADADTATAVFYGQCDPDLASAAAERLRPGAVGCMVPTGAESWREIESTYVLCTRDEALRPDSQRSMSARAAAVVEIHADHSPFFSTPDRLTDVLTAVGT